MQLPGTGRALPAYTASPCNCLDSCREPDHNIRNSVPLLRYQKFCISTPLAHQFFLRSNPSCIFSGSDLYLSLPVMTTYLYALRRCLSTNL